MGAAFDGAPAALAAAVAAMTALETEAWPTTETLRMRMGLHRGLSMPVGGEYFGPPVNRAARVMSAANGGQPESEVPPGSAGRHLTRSGAPRPRDARPRSTSDRASR
jgi:hypothetical protein